MENQIRNDIRDLNKLLPSNIISEVKEEYSHQPNDDEHKLNELLSGVSNCLINSIFSKI